MSSGVPFELVDIVTASIIFFVGAKYLIQLIQKRVHEMDEKAAEAAAIKKAAKPGMSDKRNAVIAMAISGGLAGLAGTIEGLGNYLNFFTQNGSPAIGFDGMAVALLGSGSYLGILASAPETTKQVGANASLQMKWLTDLTQGSSISAGIFIALIMIVVIWFVMTKTTLGFEIRAVGLNADAAKYLPAYLMMPSSILLGVGLGAIAGAIPGWLRAQFGASEVIVTIMMNYILLFLGNNILQNTMSKSIKESCYVALLGSAFGSMQDIGGVLTQMTPLILTALGFAVAQTAGFFNIGLSGQALAGWVGSVWYALSFPDQRYK
ncbi:hypothetical protein GQS40_11860|uniref:ABC transporter permease n=1 Tax=Leuconostoc lactis TaxID=1246 RepID=A0A6L7AC74_LEULA|nr:hypothetical protein [Leuconostoc lactis]